MSARANAPLRGEPEATGKGQAWPGPSWVWRGCMGLGGLSASSPSRSWASGL